MSQPGTFGNNSGTSDYTCLKNGLFIALEAKRNSKKASLSKKQQEYLSEVVANGGYSKVISCEDDIAQLDNDLKLRGIL
jgi:penicillin-binding protein-related factor A (putative recombinase)